MTPCFPSNSSFKTLRRATSALAGLVATTILLAGCNDSTPTGGDNNVDKPSTAEYYIQAKVNGSPVLYEAQALSNGQISQSMNGHRGDNGPKYLVEQNYSMYKVMFSNGQFLEDSLRGCPRITVYKNFNDQPWEDGLDIMLTTTMQYGGGTQKQDGVEILWTDAAGKNWCSSWGTGDQTGSTFKLTEHKKMEYQIGQVKAGRYWSKGTFNCTLYDGQGNSLPLTNGRFSLRTIFE